MCSVDSVERYEVFFTFFPFEYRIFDRSRSPLVVREDVCVFFDMCCVRRLCVSIKEEVVVSRENSFLSVLLFLVLRMMREFVFLLILSDTLFSVCDHYFHEYYYCVIFKEHAHTKHTKAASK